MAIVPVFLVRKGLFLDYFALRQKPHYPGFTPGRLMRNAEKSAVEASVEQLFHGDGSGGVASVQHARVAGHTRRPAPHSLCKHSTAWRRTAIALPFGADSIIHPVQSVRMRDHHPVPGSVDVGPHVVPRILV